MAKILELADVREIARGTLQMTFVKPEGFEFQAGQNINLMVPDLFYPDPKGPRRTFTIASAPEEPVLIFATRLSESGYKKTLKELKPGTRCEYLGPNGTFVYDAEIPAAAYIAGGIGITPFRSMLLHGDHIGLGALTVLFYGNASVETSAWHDLFAGLASREKRFAYVPTMNSLPQDDPWQGERRWLSADLALDYLPDFSRTVFFLCGPPAMINALAEQLRGRGIEEKQIRSESLWGY
jgi:ferredoxin-NADP reductase